MVDGIMLLVDAAEGPLPQTRFVLSKALDLSLPAIVVINKIDRHDARPQEVLNEIYDLFIDLDASENQIEFPVVYSIAKLGQCKLNIDEPLSDLRPLFEMICNKIPSPPGKTNDTLQILVTNVQFNSYLGPLAIGRIMQGTIHNQENVTLCHLNGSQTKASVTGLYVFDGLEQVEVKEAGPGQIIAISGMSGIGLGESIAEEKLPNPLKPLLVDEPTMSMEFRVNDSPFSGHDGQFVTSRHLRERLFREATGNLAIRIEETDSPDCFLVFGRGELQMAILIEQIRREGYEFSVGMPHVITKSINNKIHEPYELAYIDVNEEYMGLVVQKLGNL